MIAAEKWYEHQTTYVKYGLDMAPKRERQLVAENKKNTVLITSKDKSKILLFTLVLCILCVVLIVTTAYASSIKYNINTMVKESDEIQGEIENLNVAIEKGRNIKIIEEKAKNELGMIYPTYSDIIYITPTTEEVKDFAFVLKKEAYNL